MTKGRFRAGVLYGEEVQELYRYANENNFAL
ncbi:MAG: fructose-bisphosphate aldolase class II, partial [Saprospiraceae bacterium]